MRVIVGLGNPEDRYKGTRHNVGFETVNKLSFDYRIPIKKAKHRAHIGEGVLLGCPVLLVKPQTYMNLSGESVSAVLRFYKLEPSALIVVYDDVSLPLGDVRLREKGSAGGHNGMKDIINRLGTDIFPRVRIGIDPKPDGWDLADYVLSRFAKSETEAMIEGITKAGDAVAAILRDGVPAAMNTFNKRVPIFAPVNEKNDNEK